MPVTSAMTADKSSGQRPNWTNVRSRPGRSFWTSLWNLTKVEPSAFNDVHFADCVREI